MPNENECDDPSEADYDDTPTADKLNGPAIEPPWRCCPDPSVRGGRCYNCGTWIDDLCTVTPTEPPPGSWASVARIMAKDDDSGFDWDAWKDDCKNRD